LSLYSAWFQSLLSHSKLYRYAKDVFMKNEAALLRSREESKELHGGFEQRGKDLTIAAVGLYE
jgi:hypothetical protein